MLSAGLRLRAEWWLIALLMSTRGQTSHLSRGLLAGVHDAASDRASDDVCTALQLANFGQDFGRDWRNGRLFVPAETSGRSEIVSQPASATASQIAQPPRTNPLSSGRQRVGSRSASGSFASAGLAAKTAAATPAGRWATTTAPRGTRRGR